ncbi:BspA family leucine-rich repeat surface protein [Flavobacterium sp. HJSW_4]|uniref:BspA family leucine-rich repeat surface protein n=1 Tax=Flavobacterium sp. HJSW_4 TaxID=3344660 RepID=UPI0035F38BF6
MGALLQNTIFGKTKNSFVSTWRTSNTSTGSSTSSQIKLPLVSSGTYKFIVDWGDGTSNTITIWNQAETTHTYALAGDYTIKINGVCTGWQFNNTGDRLKILSVERWGRNFRLGTNQGGYFYGCANLRLDFVSDVLNLNGTSSLASAFRFCNVLTTINRSNEWNTSSITDISYISQYSPLFNPLISLWNVGNVTTMQGAFFASGFNGDISNWNTSKNTTFYLTFADNNNFNQDIGGWDTGNVLNMQQMFQSAAAFNQPINSWNTSKVTNMASMFQTALTFNQNIGSWNVSKSTNFSSMFQGATYFNNGESSDINNWQINTNAAVNMQQMFANAITFNQNIGSWNVSMVTTFIGMFQGAKAFNNGGSNTINNWTLKTSGTIITSMFQSATSFNQPIGNWNMIGVTSLFSMFLSASSFNQNIGSWNIVNVTNIQGLFGGATSFNNGGSNSINNWATTSVNNMTGLFNGASSFNQPIGNWNTTAVLTMNGAFNSAFNFNQDLSSWNTENVTTMNSMFISARSFNQNIASWNVSKVIDFTNFMAGKNTSNFSTANLDAIYNSWSTRPVVVGLTISFGTAKYTSASSAGRAILTGTPNNWRITDGGV